MPCLTYEVILVHQSHLQNPTGFIFCPWHLPVFSPTICSALDTPTFSWLLKCTEFIPRLKAFALNCSLLSQCSMFSTLQP